MVIGGHSLNFVPRTRHNNTLSDARIAHRTTGGGSAGLLYNTIDEQQQQGTAFFCGGRRWKDKKRQTISDYKLVLIENMATELIVCA